MKTNKGMTKVSKEIAMNRIKNRAAVFLRTVDRARGVALAILLTGSVFTGTPAQAATDYIDPADGTAYQSAGIGGPVLNGGVVQTYTYDVNPSSSWIFRNTNGNYWVEVSWGAYSSHNTSAVYSVDGTTYLTEVNQANDVAGGAAIGGTWSGFKALNPTGTNGISLTSGASAIKVTANGSGALSRGLWRVSLLTGVLLNPSAFGTEVATSSSPGNGKYYYVNPGSKAYAIGSALPPGYYRLEVSWGVYPTHSSAVTYSYNRKGTGGLASATTVLAGVDQRGMNDGRAFVKPAKLNSGTWSGFKSLGIFSVEAGSEIWLSGSGGAMAMGVIQATPVDRPASAGR